MSIVVAAGATALVTALASPASANHASVTAVQGNAYGYFANVGLFGGPPATRGPAPTVTLPPGGSAGPLSATAATGTVTYGPAMLFSSGPITVSTQGTTGSSGSATTSTTIQNVNTSQQEVFTAGSLSSTCTASTAGISGSTTVTGGVLVLQDPNPDISGETGEQIVNLPVNPAPNTTYQGTVANVGDNFRYVFNEQIVNPDGSLTVKAAHQYLLGPTAVGELIIGQSTCGATVAVGPARAVADFDGNGTTDRSVYRNGAWYVQGQPTVFHGLAGHIPVPGDYDGDGDIERATYSGGAWYVQGQPTVNFGLAGDIPVPGDYDDDGDTERAVYRNGAWYVEGQPTVFLGAAGDIPVPGNYDGDGDLERAVFRNGAWYVQGQPTVFLGLTGHIPVPGDYDGDGDLERAVFRNGAWYVEGQPTVFLGLAGDVPVPGNYDADAATERAVFRDGAWYVEGQPTVFFGLDGDSPLPLPQAIYRSFF